MYDGRWSRRVRLDTSATRRGTELIVLNVPNGAGPGVIRFGSRDCFFEWEVYDVQDTVRLPYRAQTGVVSCWEYFMPDGGIAQGKFQDFPAAAHFDEYGVAVPGNPEVSVWAAWYPIDGVPPRQDTLGLYSGAAALDLQLRTLGGGQTSGQIAPVGFCRYLTINSETPTTKELLYDAAAGQAIHLITTAPSLKEGFAVGPWDHCRVTAGQQQSEWSAIWDRYPEGGGG